MGRDIRGYIEVYDEADKRWKVAAEAFDGRPWLCVIYFFGADEDDNHGDQQVIVTSARGLPSNVSSEIAAKVKPLRSKGYCECSMLARNHDYNPSFYDPSWCSLRELEQGLSLLPPKEPTKDDDYAYNAVYELRDTMDEIRRNMFIRGGHNRVRLVYWFDR